MAMNCPMWSCCHIFLSYVDMLKSSTLFGYNKSHDSENQIRMLYFRIANPLVTLQCRFTKIDQRVTKILIDLCLKKA